MGLVACLISSYVLLSLAAVAHTSFFAFTLLVSRGQQHLGVARYQTVRHKRVCLNCRRLEKFLLEDFQWSGWEHTTNTTNHGIWQMFVRDKPLHSKRSELEAIWYLDSLRNKLLNWLRMSGEKAASPCNKFQANIFNTSKCQNCFKSRELHLLHDHVMDQVKKCPSILIVWLISAISVICSSF